MAMIFSEPGNLQSLPGAAEKENASSLICPDFSGHLQIWMGFSDCPVKLGESRRGSDTRGRDYDGPAVLQGF